MPKSEHEHRQDIVEIGRLMWQRGWVAANDGNITIRLDEERVLATPTGISKGMMRPDDLIVCDLDGNKIQGEKERTSEIAMHLAIYRLRSDIRAIVHAHPPVATGFAAAGRALNLALLPEIIITLGCVPLAEYGLPGTSELTTTIKPYIPNYDAILLANHGVVCYAEEVLAAYFRMEMVEHFARVSLVTELLGGPKLLSRSEVTRLLESRERYGVKAKTAGEPACPLAAEDVNPAENVARPELAALVEDVLSPGVMRKPGSDPRK